MKIPKVPRIKPYTPEAYFKGGKNIKAYIPSEHPSGQLGMFHLSAYDKKVPKAPTAAKTHKQLLNLIKADAMSSPFEGGRVVREAARDPRARVKALARKQELKQKRKRG